MATNLSDVFNHFVGGRHSRLIDVMKPAAQLALANIIALPLLTLPVLAQTYKRPTYNSSLSSSKGQSYNWSGSRFGLLAGISGGFNQSVTFDNPVYDYYTMSYYDQKLLLPNEFTSKSNKFTGGLLIGSNFQYRNFVYGYEADILVLERRNASSVNGTVSRGSWQNPPQSIGGALSSTSEGYLNPKYLSTVRLTAGLASDRTLFYGTAGLAISEIEARSIFKITGLTYVDPVAGLPAGTNVLNLWRGSKATTAIGVSFGGGVEYAFLDNMSIKFQFIQYKFSQPKYQTGGDEIPERINYAIGPRSNAGQPYTHQLVSPTVGSVFTFGVTNKF